MIRKRLALLLALCMMLSLLPIGAQAAGRQTLHETYINPAYADVIDASELSASAEPSGAHVYDANEVYTSVADACVALRAQLKARNEDVTFTLRSATEMESPAREVYNAAIVHTGVPTEGDYLRWQIGMWTASTSWSTGADYLYTVSYHFQYYTSAAQERTLDARVAQALREMQLGGKSRESVIHTIYNYVRNHVTYDNANLNNSEYKLKYTAYAALVNGTSVCQGYSVLLYRLLLEAGVDCRLVTGDAGGAHAWNIIKLGGVYYCADTTWDSGRSANRYELVGLNSFTDHTRDAEYTDPAYTSVYPTSNTDYVFGSAKTSGNLTYIVRNGKAIITECARSASGEVEIPASIDGWTVGGIGFGAFEYCSHVTAVVLPKTITQIDARAFHSSCAALTDVYYYGSQQQWKQITVAGENGALASAALHFNFCRHVMTKTTSIAPTCTTSGRPELWTCGICGEVFLDAAGKQPAAPADRTLPALGHDYESVVTAQTCTEQGYTTHTCLRCGDVYTDSYVEATGHKHTMANVRSATRTENGYTGDEVCAACGEVFAQGQATELQNALDATCTQPGYSGDEITCAGGDLVEQGHALSALGHAWGAWTEKRAATEAQTGLETRTCDRCSETQSREIPKLTPKPADPTPASPKPDGAKPADQKPADAKPALNNPFVDVKDGDYFFGPVLWALNHDPQITDGMTETTFAPDFTCTRGQVVTFLWRSMGCAEPKSTSNPFTDVTKDDYFYKAVLWAVEKGITDGTSDTTFSPNDPCTRAHVVTFLHRAENKPAAGSANPFADVAAGEYFTDAVLWAVSKGITDGTSDTTFSPNDPCTRGQIVTFLYRDMK